MLHGSGMRCPDEALSRVIGHVSLLSEWLISSLNRRLNVYQDQITKGCIWPEYASTNPAGKLLLKTPTPALRNVRRTDASGHELPHSSPRQPVFAHLRRSRAGDVSFPRRYGTCPICRR